MTLVRLLDRVLASDAYDHLKGIYEAPLFVRKIIMHNVKLRKVISMIDLFNQICHLSIKLHHRVIATPNTLR